MLKKKKHKITVSVFYQILVHFLSKGKGCRHISISSLLSRSCQEQRPHHFFYVFGFSSRFHVSSIGFGLVSSDLIGRFDWVQSRHRSRCQGCAPWCTVSLRVDGLSTFWSMMELLEYIEAVKRTILKTWSRSLSMRNASIDAMCDEFNDDQINYNLTQEFQ
ncbi:hypothetical protein Bca4012_044206 [Brassica carinata]|uniref:BnaC09g52930D protein n=2 Tax=Brassica TaxID=3705 RepID=A0A078ITZ0_BRANA|nr:BnaC09g52930D [Brassica napus]